MSPRVALVTCAAQPLLYEEEQELLPRLRARGLEAGADYFLSKGSFHDETLLQAVVDLIGPPLT